MTRRYFATVPRVQPHTDPATWPVSLRLAEVAVLTRQSPWGLYRRIQAGTVAPPPVADARGIVCKPYRWHRDTVRQFVEGATR